MKSILNFPNYAVTKTGKVWSVRRKKWLKPSINSSGYPHVTLCNETGKYDYHVHRLVLETFIGQPLPKQECRHLNGNPQDNRLENLRWGTHRENVNDAVKHGTHVKKYGEQNPLSKLSDLARRLILYQYSTGLFLQKELAMEYKVYPRTISRLVGGESWPYLNIKHKTKGEIA